MIKIESLTEKDIGRNIIYKRTGEVGRLTSWNSMFIFVRFRGPNGEACCPEDIDFE